MYSWEKHMASMWTAVVNVIRNVLRHAGSQLPCWVYHVLDSVLVFVCFCFFVLLGPSVPCAWLCFCVFFGLCLAWSDCSLWWQVATGNICLSQPALILAIFIPNEMCGFWSVWFWVMFTNMPKGRPDFKEVLPLLPGPRRQFCRLNVLLIVRYDIKTFFCQ